MYRIVCVNPIYWICFLKFFNLDTSQGHVVRCNIKSLQNGVYEVVGKMLAIMIVQGGGVPRLFSNSICQYMQCGFDHAIPEIDEIPDRNVRNSLKKVK